MDPVGGATCRTFDDTELRIKKALNRAEAAQKKLEVITKNPAFGYRLIKLTSEVNETVASLQNLKDIHRASQNPFSSFKGMFTSIHLMRLGHDERSVLQCEMAIQTAPLHLYDDPLVKKEEIKG